MTSSSIRKTDSLVSSAAKLRSDMKMAHGQYSDFVSDLAMLTKSELQPLVVSTDHSTFENGRIDQIREIFDKIQNVLYDLGEKHKDMDEIVQNIGGLEFSTSNVVDKLAEIMQYQAKEQSRMFTELNHLKNSLDSIKTDESAFNNFHEDVKEYQLTFTIFQDRVIESVPRISRVFDELDKEEEVGLKYGSTKQI